jgi:succinate dehydrogenase / fumarate reductase, cytochrome b subunit
MRTNEPILVKKRPINLNLATLRVPVTMLASGLHRISGIILFLLIPALLLALGCSLKSSEGFNSVVRFFSSFYMKLAIWLAVSALIYHLLAGIRHLLMDFGFGEELKCARTSAKLVIVLTVIIMIGLGFWLW